MPDPDKGTEPRFGAPVDREPVGQYLVGISFDIELSATEFSVVLQRLHNQERLRLLDLVEITSDPEGHTRVRETADPSMPAAALGGALWGSLIGLLLGGPIGWVAGSAVGAASGALTARFIDLGVPDEWVRAATCPSAPGSRRLPRRMSRT